MAWFLITHIFSTLLELVGTGRLSERLKDLEILILRHQLDLLERKQNTPIKPNHAAKMTRTLQILCTTPFCSSTPCPQEHCANFAHSAS